MEHTKIVKEDKEDRVGLKTGDGSLSCVGNQGSKFNMYTNRATGEIILIGIKVGIEIATQLFR